MILPNDIFFEQIEAMLASGEEVQIRIRGESMRPMLRHNKDIAVLTPIEDAGALMRGDVVLFRYKGRHVLHRIIERSGNSFTLAGDGNYRTVEQCGLSDIIGVMSRIIRPSGRVVEVSSPLWQRQSRYWLLLPAIVRRVGLKIQNSKSLVLRCFCF